MRVSIFSRIAGFIAFAGMTAAASGQVVLNTATTPTSASAGNTVTVAGKNFPAGAIPNTSVTVTITPPAGNGGAVDVLSTAVLAVGANRTISFVIPTSLVVNAPIVCTVAVSGMVAGTPYTTAGTSTITINPPPTISNVSPGAGMRRTTVVVAIAGNFTHFTNTSTITIGAPGGITVANPPVAVTSQLLTANFQIDPAATPGPRTITVKSGTETASITAGFLVSAGPGLSFTGISPGSGTLGQTLNVALSGSNTHFDATSFVNFGDGIKVNLLTVNTPTSLTANITVNSLTYLGWRMVTVVTGGEFAVSGSQGFNVTASAAALTQVMPNNAPQATSLHVKITGTNTNFLQNATTVSFGAGINVGNVVVGGPTSLDADLAVGPAATVGAHNVVVSTGGEVVTLNGAFTVSSATPFLSAVTPTSGAQGAVVNIAVTGVNTAFAPGVTADFGSNISTSVVTNTATSLTITASVGLLATTGPRTVILHAGGTDFTFQFTVTPSAAAITSVSPGSGPQGGSPSVTVTGSNTHWVQGTTTAMLSGPAPGVTVTRITVTSATSAILDLSIPALAVVGNYTLTMATGGETVTSIFSVFPNTPTLTIAPGSGKAGTAVPVSLTGEFTHFTPGVTTLNISGQGIVINGFAVGSMVSATASFVIDPAAPLGGRTVTMTTGNEIVTAPFVVTSTPAVLTSISPNHSPRSNTLSVVINGQFTNFVQGTTTVGFGPNVVVNSTQVVNATQVKASLTVDGSAAFGWRTCFVNTGAEQLQIGFHIDSPGTPLLTDSLLGSGAQGQSLTGLAITGVGTHWVQGVTQLLLGAGVTVSKMTVNNATSITADIVISPIAPIGTNSVVAITGSEVVIGSGLTVTKGAYQILSVTPNQATQNQTLNVVLVGQATHWLQGGTTADFGADISVDSLSITDATHATAKITILSQAALGLRTVTLTTSGEVADIVQGLNLVQGTPTLLSSTPNSGLQGESKIVQVLGRFTNWINGVTQASYSGGVTVNSVAVIDSVTATLSVTVDPLATVDQQTCRSLTLTTGTEQVSLPGQFCIGAGPAQVISVQRQTSTPQGSTVSLKLTGQNTHWQDGVTTADFGSGVNVSNVKVIDATHANLDIAATVNAPTGFHTITTRTLGEVATLQNGFTITPGVPTLNGVAPVSAMQGVTTTLHIISQFTNFVTGKTTATFGQGITLNSLTIVDATTADANITINPIAFTGGRTVTMTTGSEIVSGSLFSVTPGPAIISTVAPSTGNQGQRRVVTITGQGTHWAQGLTQFSMAGLGADISVNTFIVNSPTSATVDFQISPTAGLGVRSLYISTAGEVLSDVGAFVVTGGIPSITSVSPASGIRGTSGLNVTVSGVFTNWTPGVTVVDFGPGITIVGTPVINSSTSLTAVINISPVAALGFNTVTVRTGPQILTGSFQILTIVPPTPMISWLSPSVGLPGQTFSVSIGGAFTAWDLTTQITFGAGVQVNTFQVVSPTSALANITIDPAATTGTRTVTMTTSTNGEVDTASFSVIVATPTISIVDPGSALQGETGKNINVVGQFTTWLPGTTFDFGAGVTVNSVTVLGPTIATVNVAVAQLATLGGRTVTANTMGHIDTGCCFSVTPSLANITMVTPNIAMQNATATVTVTGQFTHWNAGTTFSFGGSGVSVTNTMVTNSNTATLTLAIAPLATTGTYSLTATTGGEIATLGTAFVVQPGTPLILSSGPASIQQQNSLHITVLGQFTSWIAAATTVDFGPASGITVGPVTFDPSMQSFSADITASATTTIGLRTLFVTTGAQVLTLPNAIAVTRGPAAVTLLTPGQGVQAQTLLNVTVTGTNTNFQQNVTTANFGPGVSVNSVTVVDTTHAVVNVTIAADSTAGFNTVTLTTLGEVATGANSFLINAATPVLLSVSPGSAVQGDPAAVIQVIGAFTHFLGGPVTASFGAGVTGVVTPISNTQATVTLNISPTAATGPRPVSLATTIAGKQEVAVWTNQNFQVTPSSAAISVLAPATGHQNQTSIPVAITGAGTHFTPATTVSFGTGITTTLLVYNSPTSLVATINIDPGAAIGARTVTAITGGEAASLANGFTVTTGLPAITSALPASGHQNDTVAVQITGVYTNFAAGVTTASFGAGITVVGAVAVTNATTATVNIQIGPGAALGARTITLTTGGETATLVGGFTVLTGLPQVSSITPVTGAQGSVQTMTVNGLFTNFVQGVSAVSFSGGGVTAGVANVVNGTQLTVQVTVTPGASATARTITVSTGAESASLANAFTVMPGAPTITQISPNVGLPNTPSLVVQISGQFTSFVNGVTQVNFGSGISVGGGMAGAYGPVSVNGGVITAIIAIAPGAPLGARDVTVMTGGSILTVLNGFTIQPPAPTVPSILSTSPANNMTGVPLNTAYKVVFSGPIDPSTVASTNVALSPNGCTITNAVSAMLKVDASGRILSLTPAGFLAAGTTYYFSLNYGGAPYVADPAANQLGGACYSFVAGFATDNTGPSFTMSNIAAGDTVGTNVTPILGFDKPVDPSTQAAGLSVTQGGNPVSGTWGFNTSYTQATFNPAGGFAASLPYVVSYTSGLKDSAGNPLVNPGSISFSTGATADTTAATLVSWTPVYNATTGLTPTFRLVFSKAMNPLTLLAPGQYYVFRALDGHIVPGTSVTASADRKTYTLTLPGPLDAGTSYYWTTGAVYDQAQHGVGTGNYPFTTGTAIDVTAPVVTQVSPPNGQIGVAVNAKVQILLSEPIDPSSVTSSSLQIAGVPGDVSLSADGVTMTFTPNANLNVSQAYTVNAAGFTDLSGNAVVPFLSTFTTSASATPDTTHGTITQVPATDATGVPTNAVVVFTFSKPYNPTGVSSGGTFRLYDNTSSTYVKGSVSMNAAFTTVTFTPTALQPGHQYCGYGGYPFAGAPVFDLAGNSFNYVYSQCFTTSAGVDLTPPTVVLMTPTPGMTGIGPNNPVTLTFSKPMNPTTLSGSNVAMFIGSTLYNRSFSTSFDSTTLTFSTGNLPYNTVFTVVVSPNVTDLAGNHPAAQYSATFTTAPQPAVARPTVVSFQPGVGATGISPNSAITFYVSAPLNTATVPGAIKVSANGVLMPGSVTYQSGNQVVVFQPSTALSPGARIQVWFTSAASDVAGNSLYDYMSSFTVAPDVSSTPPVLLSTSPAQNSVNAPQTTVVDLQFSKPLDAATITNANFYILQNDTTPVAGHFQTMNNPAVLRFVPNAPLQGAAGNSVYYRVHYTSGLRDTNNLPVTDGVYFFYVGLNSDNVSPTVTQVAPTNNSTGIGTNSTVRVTFSEDVDPLTIDPVSVTLKSGGNPIAWTGSYDSPSHTLTLVPQTPLPASSAIAVSLLAGVTDASGNPLMAWNSSFTTGSTPDFGRPFVTSSSFLDGQTGVPVTSAFTLTYNKPLDPRTVVLGNTIVFYASGIGNVAAALSFSPDGTQVTVTPNAVLNVNQNYTLYTCSVQDLNGNAMNACFQYGFTTALSTPAGAPVVTYVMPASGSQAPTNLRPQVQFDRPVNPLSLGAITLKQGAAAVPFAASLSAGGKIVTLTPNALLTPGVPYSLSISGVSDVSGNVMSGTVTSAFTTLSGIDLTSPVVLQFSPQSGEVTGTQPVIRITFSEPINPLASSGWIFYNQQTGLHVAGSALSAASNLLSETITFPGSLDPNTVYCYAFGNFYDLAGNYNGDGARCFTTASGPVVTAPFVTSVNPPNGQSGVPANALIQLVFNKPIDATSVTNSSITLNPAAPSSSSVQLSADGLTMTLNLGGGLLGAGAYTLNAGGFKDLNGNTVVPFASGFTTSGAADNTHGTISMSSPAQASNGVPVTSPIIVSLSKPVNPASVTYDSFAVYANNNSSQRLPGSLALGGGGTTLTFTPTSSLPAGAPISIYVGYYNTLLDLAGNSFYALANGSFTTANTPDAIPPTVSVTPTNGTGNVGPNAVVTLTFSKALDVSTITPQNLALFNGFTNLNASVGHSADNRVVTLITALPYGATITVAVATSVKDMAGNGLAAPLYSTFTTEAAPLTATPTVTQMRPANGATGVPLNSTITLYFSAPLQDVSGAFYVAQNGKLVGGTTVMSPDSRSAVFTPSAGSLLHNAGIQVFLNGAADLSGNQVNSYSASFTTGANLSATPATLIATSPSQNSTGWPTTTVVDLQFSKPILPGTVSNASFFLLQNDTTPVSGKFKILGNNDVIRFIPDAPLPGSANNTIYYRVHYTSALTDSDGFNIADGTFYFYVTLATDVTAPTVTSVAPFNGSTVGDNATVRIGFSEPMDTVTINQQTVQLLNGATPVPCSLSFANSPNTVVTLSPLAPLPAGKTLTLTLTNAITDPSGNALSTSTTTFNTGAGADFGNPRVVYSSVDNSTPAVPVNSTFTVIFDKPIDAGSLNASTYYYSVYDGSGTVPAAITLSPDGLTVTYVPAANLMPSHSYTLYAVRAVDLNGNPQTDFQVNFTTTGGADLTAPQVLDTNPAAGATGAPLNAALEIRFNEAVRATSLSQITLRAGGNPAPFTALLLYGDSVVRLTPASLLSPGTTYTLTVQGVQDVAGNTMAGTKAFSFTTGPNVLLSATPDIVSVLADGVPLTDAGTLNVAVNPTIVISFDTPVEPASLYNAGIQLLLNSNTSIGYPLNIALSADQKTATVTLPAGSLAAGTQYRFRVGYVYRIRDWAGNYNNNQFTDYPFTTP